MIEETDAEHQSISSDFNKYSSTPNQTEESEDFFDNSLDMPQTGLYNNMNRIMNTIKTSASTFDIGRLV